MKHALIWAFAASAGLAASQDDPKITYSTVAVSVERAVEAIGEMAKQPLGVSQANRRSTVLIHVTDVPLSELKKRIAEVTGSTWRVQPDGRDLLVRDASRDAQEARAELQLRARKIRETLERQLQPRQQSGTTQSQPAGFPGGSAAGSPVTKAITRLALGLDSTVLAATGPDGRVVFSTTPTRMQRPMSAQAASILQEFIQEQNQLVQNRASNEPQDENIKALLDFAERMGFGGADKPVQGQPVKALLIASRMPFFDGLTLQLKLFDSEGKVAFRGTHTVMLQSFDMAFAGFGGAPSPSSEAGAAGQDEPDGPIQLSSHSQALQGYMVGFMTDAQNSKLAPEVEERLARPDLYDPLSWAESESLLAVAKVKKLNVVASLPDTLVSPLGMFMPGGSTTTVNSYLRSLKANAEVKVETVGGWLTVVPARPADAFEKRVDRAALAKFLQVARSKPVPSLDDYAAYAMASPPPMETPAAMLPLMVFAPNTMNQGMSGLMSWDTLRLYGQLGPAQRRLLTEGGRLGFSTLNPSQRTLVEKLTFGASARLRPAGAVKKDAEGFFDMIAEMVGPGASNDYRDEPTEVMPNGLPPGGWLEMRVTADAFAMVADSGKGVDRRYGALGVDELAMLRYFAEDPNMQQMAGMIPKIDRFVLGERRRLEFTFAVAPDVVVSHTLNDDRLAPNAQPVTLDQAPAAFRERLQQRLEAFKKNPMPLFPDPTGVGRNRPPSP